MYYGFIHRPLLEQPPTGKDGPSLQMQNGALHYHWNQASDCLMSFAKFLRTNGMSLPRNSPFVFYMSLRAGLLFGEEEKSICPPFQHYCDPFQRIANFTTSLAGFNPEQNHALVSVRFGLDITLNSPQQQSLETRMREIDFLLL